jgi:hypothetical protein
MWRFLTDLFGSYEAFLFGLFLLIILSYMAIVFGFRVSDLKDMLRVLP